MRSLSHRARRSRCARALLAAAVLYASHASAETRSIDECTRFVQRDAGDDAVALTIDSTCPVPLRCRITWRLTCAPDAPRRRRALPASVAMRIAVESSETRTASAAACGDDGWLIDHVVWSCAPAVAHRGRLPPAP